VLIRASGRGDYQWVRLDAPAWIQSPSVTGNLAQLQGELGAQPGQLWLLLPGTQVNTRIVPFIVREHRHLRVAIPYQLEESIAGDIEQLHFAFGEWRRLAEPSGDNDATVAVAWCNRDWLKAQIAPFTEQALELHCVVPEPLLLQRKKGWALQLDETLRCHLDHGHGISIDAELLGPVLAMLCQQQEMPDSVTLTAPSPQLLEQLAGALPENLRGIAEQRCESLWASLSPVGEFLAHSTEQAAEINLLQGEFARRLPLQNWWQQWRSLAATGLLALTIWSAGSVLDIAQQRRENVHLQANIESAFRTVVPAGVLVDAEKQLRNRLASLDASVAYNSPVALIARIAPLIGEDAGIVMRGLTFNQRLGDVRLSCSAPAFSNIEQLLSRLNASGLTAELVHSSADGGGQQARFLIRWEQSS
jgi:general secretion pathway protein L